MMGGMQKKKEMKQSFKQCPKRSKIFSTKEEEGMILFKGEKSYSLSRLRSQSQPAAVGERCQARRRLALSLCSRPIYNEVRNQDESKQILLTANLTYEMLWRDSCTHDLGILWGREVSKQEDDVQRYRKMNDARVKSPRRERFIGERRGGPSQRGSGLHIFAEIPPKHY